MPLHTARLWSSLTKLKGLFILRARNPCRNARWASTASRPSRLRILEAIASHDPRSTAIIHSDSKRRFTYGQLLEDVRSSAVQLQQLDNAPSSGLKGERIAFLVENSYDYVGSYRKTPPPLSTRRY
jgi:long-subunit acyl-CoA synthetase (AMP-forming)